MTGIAIKGFEQVWAELEGVEACLTDTLGNPIPFIDDLGRFLLDAKGKRLRPALSVLFYKLLGEKGNRDELLRLASLMELIHLATLVHDDVIDLADTRRGRPTLHTQTSNQIAVLEGDYLFVQVFKTLSEYPKPTRDLVIGTVERVLEGELLQESLRGVLPTASQYDDVVRGKTASLIATSCLVGSQWGDPSLSDETHQRVYDAGMKIGRAFQLIDDLLDVFGDARLGKPLWGDLQGGWLTLPMIYLAEQAPELKPLLLSGELDEDQQTQLRTALDKLGIHGGLETQAHQMLDQAIEDLSWLPESELRNTLFETIDFIAKRRH